MLPDIVYLTGMMGTGKTATGQALAKMLGCQFVDMDFEIEKRCGKSVAEIFASDGEEFFRNEESRFLHEAAALPKSIVATGGGVVLRPSNIHQMKQTGRVVYLSASLEQLWSRVRGKKHRPLLNGENPYERLKKIFEIRKPLYETNCDFCVDTEGRSAAEVAQSIREKLENVHERN